MLWYPPELASLNAAARQNQTTESAINTPLKVVLGSELLDVQRTAASRIPATIETGCSGFDKILQGRIRPGLVSLAGQDDVILTMGSVSIIDTTGSFDVVRMLSVVKYRLGKDLTVSGDISEQEIAILDRVHISRVFDVEGLEQSVCELEDQLANVQSDNNPAPSIITLGNIANMFSAEITKNKTYGHARLEKLCLALRRLAVQHQIVFILLNAVANLAIHKEPALPPPLGRSFSDMIDVSMMISGPEKGRLPREGNLDPIYGLTVLEDQSTFEGKVKALFRIQNGNQLAFLT